MELYKTLKYLALAYYCMVGGKENDMACWKDDEAL